MSIIDLIIIASSTSAASTPESGGIMTQIIIASLASGGLGAIGAALISGIISKRKLGAEATEIITKAAAGVVTNLNAEVERQVRMSAEAATRHEVEIQQARDQMKRMEEDHEVEIEDVRRVLQLHVAWDAIAIAKLGDLGIELPPAPPVLPPARSHGRRVTEA